MFLPCSATPHRRRAAATQRSRSKGCVAWLFHDVLDRFRLTIHGFAAWAVGGTTYAEGNVHDLMRLYYGRLFPFHEMYRCVWRSPFALRAGANAAGDARTCFSWLAYGNDARLPHSDSTFFQVFPPSLLPGMVDW